MSRTKDIANATANFLSNLAKSGKSNAEYIGSQAIEFLKTNVTRENTKSTATAIAGKLSEIGQQAAISFMIRSLEQAIKDKNNPLFNNSSSSSEVANYSSMSEVALNTIKDVLVLQLASLATATSGISTTKTNSILEANQKEVGNESAINISSTRQENPFFKQLFTVKTAPNGQKVLALKIGDEKARKEEVQDTALVVSPPFFDNIIDVKLLPIIQDQASIVVTGFLTNAGKSNVTIVRQNITNGEILSSVNFNISSAFSYPNTLQTISDSSGNIAIIPKIGISNVTIINSNNEINTINLDNSNYSKPNAICRSSSGKLMIAYQDLDGYVKVGFANNIAEIANMSFSECKIMHSSYLPLTIHSNAPDVFFLRACRDYSATTDLEQISVFDGSLGSNIIEVSGPKSEIQHYSMNRDLVATNNPNQFLILDRDNGLMSLVSYQNQTLEIGSQESLNLTSRGFPYNIEAVGLKGVNSGKIIVNYETSNPQKLCTRTYKIGHNNSLELVIPEKVISDKFYYYYSIITTANDDGTQEILGSAMSDNRVMNHDIFRYKLDANGNVISFFTENTDKSEFVFDRIKNMYVYSQGATIYSHIDFPNSQNYTIELTPTSKATVTFSPSITASNSFTATISRTNQETQTPEVTLSYNLTATHSPNLTATSSSTSIPTQSPKATYTVNEVTITDHSTPSSSFTLSPSLTKTFSATNFEELATKLATHSNSLSNSQSETKTPTNIFTKIVKNSLTLDCQNLIKEKVPEELQDKITSLIDDALKNANDAEIKNFISESKKLEAINLDEFLTKCLNETISSINDNTKPKDNSLAIGLGIGIPAVLAIGAIIAGAALYCKRSNRRSNRVESGVELDNLAEIRSDISFRSSDGLLANTVRRNSDVGSIKSENPTNEVGSDDEKPKSYIQVQGIKQALDIENQEENTR